MKIDRNLILVFLVPIGSFIAVTGFFLYNINYRSKTETRNFINIFLESIRNGDVDGAYEKLDSSIKENLSKEKFQEDYFYLKEFQNFQIIISEQNSWTDTVSVFDIDIKTKSEESVLLRITLQDYGPRGGMKIIALEKK